MLGSYFNINIFPAIFPHLTFRLSKTPHMSKQLGYFGMIILICLSHYNRIPYPGWLINDNLYVTALEAGKSKVKALADSVFGEGLLTDS